MGKKPFSPRLGTKLQRADKAESTGSIPTPSVPPNIGGHAGEPWGSPGWSPASCHLCSQMPRGWPPFGQVRVSVQDGVLKASCPPRPNKPKLCSAALGWEHRAQHSRDAFPTAGSAGVSSNRGGQCGQLVGNAPPPKGLQGSSLAVSAESQRGRTPTAAPRHSVGRRSVGVGAPLLLPCAAFGHTLLRAALSLNVSPSLSNLSPSNPPLEDLKKNLFYSLKEPSPLPASPTMPFLPHIPPLHPPISFPLMSRAGQFYALQRAQHAGML